MIKSKFVNIHQLIKDNGYLTISALMEEIVPYYYNHSNSLGANGDFITSPEISQLFGEMIGVWCVVKWQQMGSPKKFAIVELGAGRGTLLNDLLRATKNVINFHSSLAIHIVDKSEKLKKIQWKNLSKWENIPINWHDDINHLPKIPTIIIANEFFDALPINQYYKIKNDWYEIVVSSNAIYGDTCFSYIPAPKNISDILNDEHPNAKHRSIVEISPHSTEIVKILADHINNNRGCCLIIDYGYDYDKETRTYYNSTLQAVKNHKFHPILKDIGTADITAHVDFNAITNIVKQRECKYIKTITQKEFLVSLGIIHRAENLIKIAKTGEQKNQILEGLNRLISEKQMGNLFKVLIFSDKTLTPLLE